MCGLVSGGTIITPVILAEITKSLCVVFVYFSFSFSTLYGLNNDALC